MNIKELAKDFKPKTTKNISELAQVSVTVEVQHKIVKDENGEALFDYYYIIKDDEEYRVPKSVLHQLNTLTEEDDSAEYFKVKRTGEGMSTKYTVMLL